MKVYFEVEKVGFIGDGNGCFVVGDSYKKTKTGDIVKHPAYYTNFLQCLKELHERFTVSKQVKAKTCKVLDDFIKQVEKIEADWLALVKEKKLVLTYPANRTGE